MNCIIVDDEPLARKGMEKYVAQVPGLVWKGSFGNASSVLQFLGEEQVDLLLLDIHMEGMTGIELLKHLQPSPLTILITANPEYAVEAYALDVIDYLVKPVLFERFERAVEKAREFHAARQRTSSQPFVFLKVNGIFRKIAHSDILYLEALSNYIVIHTPHEQLVVYHTMKSILEVLPADAFLRIHKSFIIHKAHVTGYSGSQVMIGGKSLPIGRVYRNVVPALQER